MSEFLNSFNTPKQIGITERTIIPPKNGWETKAYYLVDVAFSPNNIIHRAFFHAGFLNEKDGTPGGYNELAFYEDKKTISDVFYMKVIRKIDVLSEDSDNVE